MAGRRRYNFEDVGPTDEEIEAEVASILRRPADDPDRLFIESSIEQCDVIFLYAKHLVPQNGMECEPRNCEECGEPFTRPATTQARSTAPRSASTSASAGGAKRPQARTPTGQGGGA